MTVEVLSRIGPAADANGYYRRDDRCQPCGTVIAFGWYILAGTIVFVAVALAADEFFSRVSNVGDLVAPMLILTSFLCVYPASWQITSVSLPGLPAIC